MTEFHADEGSGGDVKMGNPEALKQAVLMARKKARLNQIDLGKLAGVSPKTIAKLEDQGTARFDAITRIAKTLGQPVNTWLGWAGHTVSEHKIDGVLSQVKVAPAFPQLTPEEYFERCVRRVKDHGEVGLRCVGVMSPSPVAQPSVASAARWELAKQAIRAGLHVAMVVPFPLGATNIQEQMPALNNFYSSAYNWAYQAVRKFREELPVSADRMHVFKPAIPGGAESTVVYPPLRLAEVRPMVTQYGHKTTGNGQTLFEYGVYLHFADYKKDHYVDIYSSDRPPSEHATDAFNMWFDYFRDIFLRWRPDGQGETSKAIYDKDPNGASAWIQAKV